MAMQLQNGRSEGLSDRPEKRTHIDNQVKSNNDMDMKLLAAKFADLYGIRHPPWNHDADALIAESSR